MKKCMLLIALAALAAGTACAQDGGEDSHGRKDKARNRAERMLVRDKERPGNPMTDAEVVAKFRTLADGVIAPATADRIVDLCMKFDTLEDVSPVIEFETR